ncbi:MAG: hypothetical protein QXD59_00335 [Candidatus Caldarchaeum sp.]
MPSLVYMKLVKTVKCKLQADSKQTAILDNDVGLIKDFKKLDEIGGPNKWVVAFVYPAPDSKVWSNAAASLPSTVRHWRPVTNPIDFPNWLYIALWKG